MTTPAKQIGKAEARALTDKIRNSVGSLQDLLWEAQERQAWKVLEYKTWGDYTQAEFGMTRQNAYRVIAQGKAERTIAKAAGDDVTHALQISQRDAAVINSEPAVAADIQARVKRGEEPQQAVKEAVKAADKPGPKPERKASPPTVPELDGEDRIAELEEAVKALEAETTALKAENKRFGDMKAQFEAGGFEAVIAGKDEEIRVLLTRVERESADKVKWKRSADYWKAEAAKLGWKKDGLIPLEADNG